MPERTPRPVTRVTSPPTASSVQSPTRQPDVQHALNVEPVTEEVETPWLDQVETVSEQTDRTSETETPQEDDSPFPEVGRKRRQQESALERAKNGDLQGIEELRGDSYWLDGALSELKTLWETTKDPELKKKLAPYAFETRLPGDDDPFGPSGTAYNQTMYQAYDGDPTSIRAMLRVAMDPKDHGSAFQHEKSRDILENLIERGKEGTGIVADALLDLVSDRGDYRTDIDVYGLAVQAATKLGPDDPRSQELLEKARKGLAGYSSEQLNPFVVDEILGRDTVRNPAILDVLGDYQKRDALRAIDDRFGEELESFEPHYINPTQQHSYDAEVLAPHVLSSTDYADYSDVEKANNDPKRTERMERAFEITAERARKGDPVAIAELAKFASYKPKEDYRFLDGNFEGRAALLAQAEQVLGELGGGEHGSLVTDALLDAVGGEGFDPKYLNPAIHALLGNAGAGLDADDPRLAQIKTHLTDLLQNDRLPEHERDANLADKHSALSGLERLQHHLGESDLQVIGDTMARTDADLSVRAAGLFSSGLENLDEEKRQPLARSVVAKMGANLSDNDRNGGYGARTREKTEAFGDKLVKVQQHLTPDDYRTLMSSDWTTDGRVKSQVAYSALQSGDVDGPTKEELAQLIQDTPGVHYAFRSDPKKADVLQQIADASQDPELKKKLYAGLLENRDPTKIQTEGQMARAKQLDWFAQMLVEQNTKEILHNRRGGQKLANDMWWQVPQYYGVGMAYGFKQGQKILDHWLKGMEYGKDLATLDPKKFNGQEYLRDKTIGHAKNKLVDHLQKNHIESDAGHEIVTQLKNADAITQMIEGYMKPEDPARRLARMGFDALMLMPTLIKNDLDTQGIKGEQRRNMEYTLVEKWMDALPPHVYGDLEDGTPRTSMPDFIQNPPEGFEHLSGVIHHLWAQRYMEYRRKNPRQYGPDVEIPEHGAPSEYNHPKRLGEYWDDNRGEYVYESRLTPENRRPREPYSERVRCREGVKPRRR